MSSTLYSQKISYPPAQRLGGWGITRLAYFLDSSKTTSDIDAKLSVPFRYQFDYYHWNIRKQCLEMFENSETKLDKIGKIGLIGYDIARNYRIWKFNQSWPSLTSHWYFPMPNSKFKKECHRMLRAKWPTKHVSHDTHVTFSCVTLFDLPLMLLDIYLV